MTKNTKKKPTTPSPASSKDVPETLEQILSRGEKKELRALFSFDSTNSEEEILLKFNLWGRYFFPQYFKYEDAHFHVEMDRNNCLVYMGILRAFVNVAFRGSAKTTRKKLWDAFAISNDSEHRRKFMRVFTKDISNAKQIVTDIYNMLISPKVAAFYPEIFQETTEKREETMASFTTATGVKVRARTVGQDARGQLQEDARPDYDWYDDFETRKTLRSAVETQKIWDNMEEARTGLSRDGGSVYTCNYVSERGNVHKLVQPADGKEVLVVPIIKDGKPTWNHTVEEIEVIRKNADDFEGEYLCEPSAGTDIFFDRSCLDRQIKKVPIRTIADFKIFYAYDPSHRYGSGHDVAGGVGLDSSTSAFIDFSTLPNRVVATFKSNTIKPDTFGDEIKAQADRFGAPIVAVENNKYDMCIGRLKQIYDNLYFKEEKETRLGMPEKVKTYGWNTNGMSKPKMLFELKKAVEDGLLELSDPDVTAELRSYTRDDLMDRDDDVRLTTRHFDLLVAVAIAWQMRNFATVKKEEGGGYVQPAYERSGLDSDNQHDNETE